MVLEFMHYVDRHQNPRPHGSIIGEIALHLYHFAKTRVKIGADVVLVSLCRRILGIQETGSIVIKFNFVGPLYCILYEPCCRAFVLHKFDYNYWSSTV